MAKGKAKRCKSSIDSDSGREYCQRKSGHKGKHWYTGKQKAWWCRVSWWIDPRKRGEKR